MHQFIRPFFMTTCLILCLTTLITCSPPKEKGNKQPIKKPVPVKVQEIKAVSFPMIIESVGRLSADKEVTLAAEVGGIVEQYLVDVGDRVKTGQLLGTIRPVDYKLALNEARANLAATQARLEAAAKAYRRSKKLLPQKAISSDFFEKSEAEYKSAKASLAQVKALVNIAEERLRKTKITAPFNGLIADRMIEKGQTVGAGTPLMTIAALDSVRVNIHLTECDYMRIDRTDPVSVSLEAITDKTFIGQIDRIGIKADERTNTFKVEILIDNPNHVLKSGLTGRVRITTDIIPDAILIPQSAVLYREDRKEVFIVGMNQTAQRRVIRLGQTNGSRVRILDGLKAGDKLIVTGGQYVRPGDKITISTDE